MSALKISLSAFFAALSVIVHAQAQLIILMTAAAIIDYVTGITAAAMAGEGLSSKTAFTGAVKKVCYYVMVCAAFLIDLFVTDSAARLNIPLDTAFTGIFGALTLCYLISGDIISVLEHLSKIGITVPLLTPVIKAYREKIFQSTRPK